MTIEPDDALLCCPHCNGAALLIRPHNGANPYVMCNANYCTAPKPTEAEAIAAWNTRAGQAHAGRADAGLLAALEDIERLLAAVAPEYEHSTMAANARAAIAAAKGA